MSAEPRLTQPRLKSLLDLCDRLGALREQAIEDGAGIPTPHGRQQKIRARKALARLLSTSPPRALNAALREGGVALDVDCQIIVATLLHRRIGGSDPAMTGRELLWAMADSTYELLTAARHLDDRSNLIAGGYLTVARDSETASDEPLDRRYALSASLWRAFLEDETVGAPNGEAARPFVDDAEIVLAWADLLDLMQRRAAKIFDWGLWRELHGEPPELLDDIERRIVAARRSLRERLRATVDARKRALPAFEQEFGLSTAETTLVVLLLVQETLHGSGALDTIDALRVLSSSPRDLLRLRRLLANSARLVREGIVVLESDAADASMAGSLHLSPWVVERLVDASVRAERDIPADERIEFHDYLRRLDGSDDFFDRL